MGLGICVVGVGAAIGITTGNLKPELAYFVSGLLLFSAGQLLLRRFRP
jgi:hypothetical protein